MDTEAQQALYRQRLLDLETEINASIADEAGQTGIVHLDGSMGRVSRNDALQSQQMALALQRRQQERLLRVQSALMRLDQGTYGRCMRCGQAIAEGRLDLQPEAVLCVRCAAQPRP